MIAAQASPSTKPGRGTHGQTRTTYALQAMPALLLPGKGNVQGGQAACLHGPFKQAVVQLPRGGVHSCGERSMRAAATETRETRASTEH